MLKRLSTQIYLTILASLVVFAMLAGFFWRHGAEPLPIGQALEIAGEMISSTLPSANAPESEQADAVLELAQRLHIDLALFSPDRRRITTYGRPVPPPPERSEDSGLIFDRNGPAWALPLPDGRWIVARLPRHKPFRHGFQFILFLGGIVVVIGLCAWPVVRGLTRRLERLERGVDSLGRGDLTTRVEVSGRDEVARLATSFNRSAERIEALVRSHKLLLANASHELRTPLARIRMGLELIGTQNSVDSQRMKAMEQDIGELDDLIEEILLLSRLDALEEPEVREELDLLAVAAEEGAHYAGCEVSGEPATMIGDARLLRRLIRNLLENASKHGAPPISIRVRTKSGRVFVRVHDCGAGVTPELSDRVFEPFYRGPSRGTSGGSGLGLALVRQIAQRHGGTARFESDDGEGGKLNTVVVELAAGR